MFLSEQKEGCDQTLQMHKLNTVVIAYIKQNDPLLVLHIKKSTSPSAQRKEFIMAPDEVLFSVKKYEYHNPSPAEPGYTLPLQTV